MITKNNWLNDSEKYLTKLCEKTFLSLRSYANVYKQPGKELCDLLVVVWDDIIIFSDKSCEFALSGDLNCDWNRRFRRAVEKSARQLWGAERRMREHSQSIFLDSKCDNKLPIPIVITEKTKFHLILVAHGSTQTCKKVMNGGSGSMMIKNAIKGIENHVEPFSIWDLDPTRTLIHVLDDTTLDILLRNRDTIKDFTHYLSKREKLLRSSIGVASAWEEELLAIYLKQLNSEGEHDFVLPTSEKPTFLVLWEGEREGFQKSEQRLTQIEADKISYMRDMLIEAFNKHALDWTQYYVSEWGFLDSEKAIRFLALENRFMRRVLANNLYRMISTTPSHMRRLSVAPMLDRALYYVFLLFPHPNSSMWWSEEDYRNARRVFLESSCLIVKLMYPDAQHVIWIAMQSEHPSKRNSEDLMYFDCINWNSELEERAKKDQQDLGILIKPTYFGVNEKEYPS